MFQKILISAVVIAAVSFMASDANAQRGHYGHGHLHNYHGHHGYHHNYHRGRNHYRPSYPSWGVHVGPRYYSPYSSYYRPGYGYGGRNYGYRPGGFSLRIGW